MAATTSKTAPAPRKASAAKVLTREQKDALYANGTRADRDALYRVNGALDARKAKGYGRAALAKELGRVEGTTVPEKDVWHAEFYLDKGTPELTAWLARIAKCAQASKPSAAVGHTASKAEAGKTLSANHPARKGTAKASDVI